MAVISAADVVTDNIENIVVLTGGTIFSSLSNGNQRQDIPVRNFPGIWMVWVGEPVPMSYDYRTADFYWRFDGRRFSNGAEACAAWRACRWACETAGCGIDIRIFAPKRKLGPCERFVRWLMRYPP